MEGRSGSAATGSRLRGRIERYVVGPEIGRGVGVVYEVWDTELQRKLAMKVLAARDADWTDSRSKQRFTNEARVTAQLEHPGIVPIHEPGRDETGQPFFTMGLVRGQSLIEVAAQPTRSLSSSARSTRA